MIGKTPSPIIMESLGLQLSACPDEAPSTAVHSGALSRKSTIDLGAANRLVVAAFITILGAGDIRIGRVW